MSDCEDCKAALAASREALRNARDIIADLTEQRDAALEMARLALAEIATVVMLRRKSS